MARGDYKRDRDFSSSEKYKDKLEKLFSRTMEAWTEKNDQNDRIERFWDIYHCILGPVQTYQGDSKVFVPLIHDAIEARATRFSNMLFPPNGKRVDVITSEEPPYEQIALLEHYIDTAKLRLVIPALMRAGDIEGQYNLYVDWRERTRHVLRKIEKPLEVSVGGMKVMHPTETYMDQTEDEVKDAGPNVEILDTRDLLVAPATIDTINDAEIVCVSRRLSEEEIRRRKDTGEWNSTAADSLLKVFTTIRVDREQPDPQKDKAKAVGVQVRGAIKFAIVWQVFSRMKIGKKRRLVECWFGGHNLILSARLAPFWNDRVPIISVPQRKIAGSFWGQSPIEPIEQLQYQANDAVNIGLDSAKYSLMPIVMTDPKENPQYSQMVLSMAAVWPSSPKSTDFAKFPVLWPQSLEVLSAIKGQIMESLGLNPALMPQGIKNPRQKPTQAQVAQEQMVAVETTADALTILQEGLLNPLLEWFFEMDHQFRDKDITVKQFGEMGYRANMVEVPPLAMDTKYKFTWVGSDSFKSTQEVQQQIGFLNVLMRMPPQALGGRTIDAGPMIERACERIFGARLAPKILKDMKHQLSIDPEEENKMIADGFPVAVSPLDDHKKHIEVHKQLPPGAVKDLHIAAHTRAMQQQAMAVTGAQAGPPGGGPRPGATGGKPRGGQNPPGSMKVGKGMNDPGAMPPMQTPPM